MLDARRRGEPDAPVRLRRFTRDPRQVALEGIRADAIRPLAAELPAAYGCDRLLVADLTLGSWRVHHAARELFLQLQRIPPLAPRTASPAYGELARRADAETRGDRAALEALQLAKGMLSALDDSPAHLVCVLLPRTDAVVERQDVLFIRFLAQGLAPTSHTLVLVAGDDARPPANDWSVSWTMREASGAAQPADCDDLLTLVPGVLGPEEAQALSDEPGSADGTLALLGGCLLVDPAMRPPGTSVPAARYAQLAIAGRGIPWLAAFACYHSPDESLDPWLLWRHAIGEFAAGACELPLLLLDRALTTVRSPVGRALIELLAQAVRIANQRFDAAAKARDPAAEIPAPLRGMLLQSKGWALTMTGPLGEAERCLESARVLLRSTPASEEYLSLLNISALNRLNAGDWDGALGFERQIRSALDSIPQSRWQFAYVNSLNLARLYRRREQFDLAERYYLEAFDTTTGVRTDSDAIHLEVSIARVEEARGRSREAFEAWTRAALHWASCEAPEAIAPRVTGVIIRAGGSDAAGNVCDAVSDGLVARMRATAPSDLQRHLTSGFPQRVTFLASEAVSSGVLARAEFRLCAGRGWAVLCSGASTAPALSSPASARLREALAAVVLAGEGAGTDASVKTILVDDQLGRGIPRSEVDLLSVCLRLGIRTLAVGHRVVELDDELRNTLEARHYVRLGRAVASVSPDDTGVIVRFRRYREPATLSGAAGRVASTLAVETTVESLRSRLASEGIDLPTATLRQLESQRVVELRLPSEAMAAVGADLSRAWTRGPPA